MVKVENCFNAAALATGCTVKMKWRDAGMCKSMCLSLYNLLYMMTTYSSNNITRHSHYMNIIFKSNNLTNKNYDILLFIIDVTQNSVMAETYTHYYNEFGRSKPIASRQEQEALQLGGSTDFGNVSVLVPALHPFFVIPTDSFPHTHEFAEAAGTVEAHKDAIIASKSLAMVGAHMFLEKGFYEKANVEFETVLPKEKRIQE